MTRHLRLAIKGVYGLPHNINITLSHYINIIILYLFLKFKLKIPKKEEFKKVCLWCQENAPKNRFHAQMVKDDAS